MVKTTLPAASPGAGRRVITYNYDERGLPTSLPGYVKSATFDLGGRLVSYTQQNGVVNQVDFIANTKLPAHLRVTAPDGTALRDLAFHYDGTANTTSVDSPLDLERASFTYDELGRLTTASYGNGDHFAYAYTDGGSISHIDGVGDVSLRPSGSAQVDHVGADGYSYDAAGRMQSTPFGNLRWDGQDRLLGVTLKDGRQETYAYDHAGSRVFRRDADGKESYVIGPSMEIVDGTPVLWVNFLGRRVLGLFGGAAVFPHYDQLGQATLFTDAAGGVIRRLSFGPYGALRQDSGAAPAPGDLRLGGRFDATTGLVCMGLRYYDPRLGRFISADVVVGALALDGWNRYAYAHGNPMRFIDPTGLSVGDVLAIIGMIVLVAVLVVAAYYTAGVSLVVAAGISVNIGGLLHSDRDRRGGRRRARWDLCRPGRRGDLGGRAVRRLRGRRDRLRGRRCERRRVRADGRSGRRRRGRQRGGWRHSGRDRGRGQRGGRRLRRRQGIGGRRVQALARGVRHRDDHRGATRRVLRRLQCHGPQRHRWIAEARDARQVRQHLR